MLNWFIFGSLHVLLTHINLICMQLLLQDILRWIILIAECTDMHMSCWKQDFTSVFVMNLVFSLQSVNSREAKES